MALGGICVVTYSRSTQVTFSLRSRLTLTMAVHCLVVVVNVYFGRLRALCKIVMCLFFVLFYLQERACCPKSSLSLLLFVSGPWECGERALHVR